MGIINRNKNDNNIINNNDNLAYDPTHDKFLKKINLKCILDNVVVTKNMFNIFDETTHKDKFVLRTREEVKYKSCKPLKKIMGKVEKTIDKERIFTPSLTVVFDKEEELHLGDPSISPDIQKLMIQTRIKTLDNKINNIQLKLNTNIDDNEKSILNKNLLTFNKSKENMIKQLKYYEDLKEEKLKKKLFG